MISKTCREPVFLIYLGINGTTSFRAALHHLVLCAKHAYPPSFACRVGKLDKKSMKLSGPSCRTLLFHRHCSGTNPMFLETTPQNMNVCKANAGAVHSPTIVCARHSVECFLNSSAGRLDYRTWTLVLLPELAQQASSGGAPGRPTFARAEAIASVIHPPNLFTSALVTDNEWP